MGFNSGFKGLKCHFMTVTTFQAILALTAVPVTFAARKDGLSGVLVDSLRRQKV